MMFCKWCGKHNRRESDWEQKNIMTKEWLRLCIRCANSRLNNPFNALLPMREVTPESQDDL